MKLQIILIISLLVVFQNVQGEVSGIISYTCLPMNKVFTNATQIVGNPICENSSGYAFTFLNTTSSSCQYLRKLNQTCGSAGGGTCENSLYCSNGTCHYVYYLDIGEACPSDFELACNSENCTDGKCAGPSDGCIDIYDCAVGQYCDIDSGNCLTQKNKGGACDSSSNGECTYGLFCSNSTCVSLFSLQLNDTCTENNQCDYTKNLFCENSKCAVYSKTSGNCTASSICNSNEWCNGITSTCETYETISADAQTTTLDYYACMKQYSCMDTDLYTSAFSPVACGMKHCGAQVCEFLSLYLFECETSIYDNSLCAGYKPTPTPTETPSSSNQLTSGLFFALILLFITLFSTR